jgi:FkbM family methyltransferase
MDEVVNTVLLKRSNMATRTELIKAWAAADGDHTLLLNYPLTNDSVVLDVGGFYGDWTYNLLAHVAPAKPRVYMFEPVQRFYDGLKYRFRDDGANTVEGSVHFSNVTVIQAALSDRTGDAMIADEEEGSSMHHAMAETPIKTLDVADFIYQYGIEKVDLASINIEGHEFTLLPRILATGLVERFENIQVQFHSFYPNADTLRGEISAKLSLTHEQTYCYPFVWENWRKK